MSSSPPLLPIIEQTLLGPSPPTPSQRIELMRAIRTSLPALQSLLSYPGPKASDRTQVQSKEVRLPNLPPTILDDVDVHIALKLSDELNLNELDCVRLLLSTNKEWGLLGRDPVEIFRLAAGLWYSERKDIISSFYALLRAVVLDQGTDAELVDYIQKYLEEILSSGLQQRLIILIKDLNREDAVGLGGPSCERYVLDSRGAVVDRRDVVLRERLTLSHCLLLSVLVVRMSPKDFKDTFTYLKDCSAGLKESNVTTKIQVVFSLLFSLLIALISGALSAIIDEDSILLHDASFRREFHEMVTASSNDTVAEGFVNVIRLAWCVHVTLTQDGGTPKDLLSDSIDIYPCLDHVCSHNVFQFLLDQILLTAAYQNDDEDVVYMYNGYLHKLLMCFVSHPTSKNKVKDLKGKAMNFLGPYGILGSDNFHDDLINSQQSKRKEYPPFVSLLELLSSLYKKEPAFLHGNEDLWTFVMFAGEGHTNIQTLLSFLRMLSSLASSEETSSKVYELLQSKIFRSIGWSTLFDCLSIYEDKFRNCIETPGSLLPDFQEADAQALVAYLNVLQQVVKHGNPIERKKWFPDIEPLFKLLSYENVPPVLKGALRNSIAVFIHVSPVYKDIIWTNLERFDLPVVVGPVGRAIQDVYNMRFELNEVESRIERYPSTISFIELVNALIAEEKDVSDRGRRFMGIFRFIYDHVFGPCPHRAYADPSEKWQLVCACLQHFKMLLILYDIKEEEVDIGNDLSDRKFSGRDSSVETQLPALELFKDFMGGKTIFRNIMSILLLGVNTIIDERNNQLYGQCLEKAVLLSLEIIVLVLEKDVFLSDYWHPLYQPLDVLLSQDHNQIAVLLEYVRYSFCSEIQLCSIKIMKVLSSRMVGLVPLLLKSNAANSLISDYASCLELRFDESQPIENTKDDLGILILQLLIDNIGRPPPNITQLLLKFDVDSLVDHTILRPKFNYSCLKVILDNLETLPNPDVNCLLQEFSFQLLYELCLDPLTTSPIMDLLSSKKYQFFVMHLGTIGVAPLPNRTTNQALRISTLHQRAWLLKLHALLLHLAVTETSAYQETTKAIISQLYGIGHSDILGGSLNTQISGTGVSLVESRNISKNKIIELLEIVQFRPPDVSVKYTQLVPDFKYEGQVEDILKNPATSDIGGVYYFSERGDRLVDLDAFQQKLWQMFKVMTQGASFNSDVEKAELRESTLQLLRWLWKYNKNLEEQAAQLHMLSGWCQIVEISVSRRMSLLGDRSQILFQLLDASLSASASPDCSLKMALVLNHAALTCMAKLRDERFLFAGALNTENVTCLDILTVTQFPIGACHSILLKHIVAILRNESSELLRRRQYASLLIYFRFCQSLIDPDVPTSILECLLREHDQDNELNLQEIDRQQNELSRTNFALLRKDAQEIIDVVIKDAVHGNEAGKAISFYILDALISIDQETYFLSQLQSRGLLRVCIEDISNFYIKAGPHSLEALQRLYRLEAQLCLLLRVSHKYGKYGAQILLSMGALENLLSCRITSTHAVVSSKRGATETSGDLAMKKQNMLVAPILRLVSCLTSLVESSNFLEVKNKIVREVVDFVKAQQSLFGQNLRQDVLNADVEVLERVNLVAAILSKVWPYEESDDYGFVQELFGLMHLLFPLDLDAFLPSQSSETLETQKKSNWGLFGLCFSLLTYLYSLIQRKSLRLQLLDSQVENSGNVVQQLPTLALLVSLLHSACAALERVGEERFMLIDKAQNVNELSRQEVDEFIATCARRYFTTPEDNIGKRRFIAMVEICRAAGNCDQLITLLLQLAERVLSIILIHLQERDSFSIEDVSHFCGKLLPTFERLEHIREVKIGCSLKQFQRSIRAVKDICIRSLAS